MRNRQNLDLEMRSGKRPGGIYMKTRKSLDIDRNQMKISRNLVNIQYISRSRHNLVKIWTG